VRSCNIDPTLLQKHPFYLQLAGRVVDPQNASVLLREKTNVADYRLQFLADVIQRSLQTLAA
jgi:hypothetical protein